VRKLQTNPNETSAIEQMKKKRPENPGKNARESDRRVTRTRELLEQALLALIKEKPFDSISVQDIVDRANVGRATFYLHYQNKEDLLGSGFAGLQVTLREQQKAVRRSGVKLDEMFFAFSFHLLQHAHKHREVFPAMLGKNGGVAIQHVLRKLLTELMREEVSAISSVKESSQMPTAAAVEFLSSGLFGLMVWWLNGRARLSPEEMNDTFRRLAIPVLRSAVR